MVMPIDPGSVMWTLMTGIVCKVRFQLSRPLLVGTPDREGLFQRSYSLEEKQITRKQAVEGGKAIELSAAMEEWKRGDVEVVATATRYGYAPIPMMSVYDLSSKLLVLSWNRSVTTKGKRRRL
jgi:hypothetical protein